MSAETVRNAVATRARGEVTTAPGETVYDLMERVKPQLARALPEGMSPERFSRIILTEVRKNPELKTCTADSLLGAVLTAAQLGLEPGPTQHCYLIPRWNGKIKAKEVQLMIGYRGIVDLALRGGRTLDVDAHVVRDGDEFSFEYGTDPHLRHVPKLIERGAPIAAYAVARLPHGGAPFVVLSPDEVDARRAHSEAGQFSPWNSDPDSMWRKSCVRALAPYLPQTPEFAQAQRVDGTVRTDLETSLEDYEPPTIDTEGTEIDPEPASAGSEPGAEPVRAGDPPGVQESGSGDESTDPDPAPGSDQFEGPDPAEPVNPIPAPPSKRPEKKAPPKKP